VRWQKLRGKEEVCHRLLETWRGLTLIDSTSFVLVNLRATQLGFVYICHPLLVL
jgi:hypothetical protein